MAVRLFVFVEALATPWRDAEATQMRWSNTFLGTVEALATRWRDAETTHERWGNNLFWNVEALATQWRDAETTHRRWGNIFLGKCLLYFPSTVPVKGGYGFFPSTGPVRGGCWTDIALLSLSDITRHVG